MIGKVYYITNHEGNRYTPGTFGEFVSWFAKQKAYQLDIETNGTKDMWWNKIELRSIQFGSCTPDRVQWFLQWSALTTVQKGIVKNLLEDARKLKLIHNAAYEYVVLRFHDIIIENVYDTMLAEKVLMGGMEIENYALTDISYKYLRIIMDKSLQMGFADDIITDEKVEYGITDVAYLDTIKSIQMMEALLKDLSNVIGLENDAVLAFSDITFNGMLLDKEKWRENERLAWPLVHASKKKINEWLMEQPFRNFAIAKGYISDTDRVVINFNSPAQKKNLLQLIIPAIPGASDVIMKAWLRDNGTTMEPEHMEILLALRSKDYKPFQKYLLMHHREYLIEHEYLLQANVPTINWNSRDQVLPLMQLIEPKLKDLSEDSRNKCVHPILKNLEKYKQSLKLVNDLGETWINKYCGPDGYVRTNWNQIVSTGRVSSSNPNMQNITVDDSVGTRYRNAFICEKGWVFVDSDYVSQELVIIAYISKDPVWMEAIDRSWDLHSIVAKMMYGRKWDDAAQADCAFVKNKEKCNCKKHKSMRYDSKTISFGLAYGMSEFKLASTLGISVKEAMGLLKLYFSTFPLIGRTLEFLGRFGVENGYIMTLAPFFRKRWFPYWKEWSNYIEPHLMGIKHVPPLGDIERQSKNQPIQGSSADIVKVAMVMVREYIRDNKLWNDIKLCAQVHDQITTICKEEISVQWRDTFDGIMREAAKVVIPTGILRADTNITTTWTK